PENPGRFTQSQTEPQKIDFPDYQAEFDTVSDTELPTSEFSADFNPVSWGSSASCPPDLTTTVRGVNLVIRTAPICDAAETFRPLILVLASLSAAGIALGVRTRGSD
ncbi:virulence factor TspB C-terminal domain-related protein, partial [Nitrosomonas sp.]|uniref:virulence factor TspB C-terminal domain-related protein n=1 Tax=Nitrosomonas sp. TaxID=42353 RepID=UPI001DA9822D